MESNSRKSVEKGKSGLHLTKYGNNGGTDPKLNHSATKI